MLGMLGMPGMVWMIGLLLCMDMASGGCILIIPPIAHRHPPPRTHTQPPVRRANRKQTNKGEGALGGTWLLTG
jgi:hypothetical protein